jgi:hypothetical protein
MTITSAAATAPQQLPPDAQLLGLVSSAWTSAAVFVAAKLGIAGLLKDGPKSIEYLSVATSTHDHSLYRTLRAVASAGVFTELEGKTFANTPMSETLRSDHPNSVRDLTIWINEPEHWKVYGDLMHSVKTGEPAWDKTHGEPVFTYLFKTNPELGGIFNKAMASFSHQTIVPLVEAYDFSSAEVIADIGGGLGHLLGAVLNTNEAATGVLFDMPEVLQGAPEMLRSCGVADRVEIMSGDFTDDIPVVADVYILKHIIHDWYDDKNRVILGNIRNNMPDSSKILIIETIVPEGNDPHFSKIIDLEMLAAPGGMERTSKEFEELLISSGLKLNRVIPTKGMMSVIEAVKA